MIINITENMADRIVASGSGGVTGMIVGFVELNESVEVLIYGMIGALGGLIMREIFRILVKYGQTKYKLYKARKLANKTKQTKLF